MHCGDRYDTRLDVCVTRRVAGDFRGGLVALVVGLVGGGLDFFTSVSGCGWLLPAQVDHRRPILVVVIASLLTSQWSKWVVADGCG